MKVTRFTDSLRNKDGNWSEGQHHAFAHSPHPLTAEAANPAADSPDTRPIGYSLPPDLQLANKPCNRAALGFAVGNQVIRVQAAFGVVGSVPCLLFRCGVLEATHVGPSTIRVSGELTPANPPGVHQLKFWWHGRDANAGAVTPIGPRIGCYVRVGFDIQLSSLVSEELA